MASSDKNKSDHSLEAEPRADPFALAGRTAPVELIDAPTVKSFEILTPEEASISKLGAVISIHYLHQYPIDHL